MGDSVGAARLAAADDRINRVLADAVERHATTDPGVTGILKRVIPNRRLRRKLCWTQSRDFTPHPSVSYGGSSASGAQRVVAKAFEQATALP